MEENIVLTKKALQKFYNSPIEVRLLNGCFNRAVVEVANNRKEYSLRVDVTHPFLEWQCGNKDGIELVYKGYIYTGEDIPKELNELIEKMKEAATMTDEEAFATSSRSMSAFRTSMKELGII